MNTAGGGICIERSICILLSSFAIGGYLLFLSERAINVPYHDDILDVLGFLSRFAEAAPLQERLTILFEQYNDHRTAASRVVYLLLLKVRGQIDFRELCLLANFLVLGLVALYAAVTIPGRRLGATAIAVLLLCQPRGSDFLLWPMSVLAFQGVIFYGFAALLALRELRPWRFSLAVLAGGFAMFSLSSGQLVWVAGTASLLYSFRRSERHAAVYLALWLLAGIGFIAFFHHGFHNPSPLGRLLDFAVADPANHLAYFLAMLGSATAFGQLPAAILAGATLLSLLVMLSRRGLRQGFGVPVFFAWYLVLGMAVITMGRAPYSLMNYALEPRYSVFSSNLVAAMAVLAVSMARRRIAVLGIVIAVVYCVLSYRYYTPAVDAVLRARAKAYDTGNFWVFGFPMEQTNRIVAKAVRHGFYAPPARPLEVPLSDD